MLASIMRLVKFAYGCGQLFSLKRDAMPKNIVLRSSETGKKKSGSRMASETQAEITRVRALRTAALASAGVQHPEESSLWDTPDEGFGYGLSKLQQLVFDDFA